MGQAKQKGTKQQRKNIAITQNKEYNAVMKSQVDSLEKFEEESNLMVKFHISRMINSHLEFVAKSSKPRLHSGEFLLSNLMKEGEQ